LPNKWAWAHLTAVYFSISPSGKKLKTSEIKEEGRFPVVDQGQTHIAGYSDDESLLLNIPGPVVVFGDHTKARKYIDFDFIAGADGTKILCPIAIYPRYFYLHILNYDLESRGYARHFKILNDNLFATPPLSEQHRIVQKVDELMALCDRLEQQTHDQHAAHETLVDALLNTLTQSADADKWARVSSHFDTLFTTEHSIDRLKQTILQLAVMGRLAPRDPKDEPASVLLEQIAADNERVVKDKKLKKPNKLPVILDGETPFEIPSSWEWIRIGTFAHVKGGKRIPKGHSLLATRTAQAYIRVTDMKDGTVRLDDIHYISEAMSSFVVGSSISG
jgi:type I restriction enzyme S subunit